MPRTASPCWRERECPRTDVLGETAALARVIAARLAGALYPFLTQEST